MPNSMAPSKNAKKRISNIITFFKPNLAISQCQIGYRIEKYSMNSCSRPIFQVDFLIFFPNLDNPDEPCPIEPSLTFFYLN